MDGSEGEGDLVLIQTFFALLWKLFLKNTGFDPWVWFISLTRCELDLATIEMRHSILPMRQRGRRIYGPQSPQSLESDWLLLWFLLLLIGSSVGCWFFSQGAGGVSVRLRQGSNRRIKVEHETARTERKRVVASEGAGTFGEVTSREVTGCRQECDKVLRYLEALFFCLYS